MGCCFTRTSDEDRIPLLPKTPIKTTRPHSGSLPKIVQILQVSQKRGLVSQQDVEDTKTLIENKDFDTIMNRVEENLKNGKITQGEYQKITHRYHLEDWYRRNTSDEKSWDLPLDKYYKTMFQYNDKSVVFQEDGYIKECSLDVMLLMLLGPKSDYEITEREMMIDCENILLTCSRQMTSDEILLKKFVMIYSTCGIQIASKLADFIKMWIEHLFSSFSIQFKCDLIKFVVQSDFDEDVVRILYNKLSHKPDSTTPVAQVPKNVKNFQLLDWTAVELARQISVLDMQSYQKIAPQELLFYPDPTKSVHLVNFLKDFDRLESIIINMILDQKDIDQRIEYLMASIDLAEALLKLKNYHSAAAILSALQNPAINRLSRTWDQISEESEQVYKQMKITMSKKYNKIVKESIEITNSPFILHLNPILSEWSKTTKDVKNVEFPLNATKYRMMSKTYLPIAKSLQVDPYKFEWIEMVQNYFSQQVNQTSKQFLVTSQQLEK